MTTRQPCNCWKLSCLKLKVAVGKVWDKVFGGCLRIGQQQLWLSEDRPCRILPRLYLGSCDTEADWCALKALGVTHVLQVGLELAPTFPHRLQYKQIPVYDSSEQDIVRVLPASFDFIDKARQEGGVLVHCAAGISRSATVVIAYLMCKEQYTLEQALWTVRASRPRINPNRGFMLQLNLLEYSGCELDLWPGWCFRQARSSYIVHKVPYVRTDDLQTDDHNILEQRTTAEYSAQTKQVLICMWDASPAAVHPTEEVHCRDAAATATKDTVFQPRSDDLNNALLQPQHPTPTACHVRYGSSSCSAAPAVSQAAAAHTRSIPGQCSEALEHKACPGAETQRSRSCTSRRTSCTAATVSPNEQEVSDVTLSAHPAKRYRRKSSSSANLLELGQPSNQV